MTRARQLVVGTAGHIDHGKTALVRALTGVETDRLPAERKRGITIDLGFAPLQLGDRRLAMVDVPGHERFIRNMLAGATGLDLALLVVAADDSVMPQTREHLEILRLLGLSSGLVALTKCDLADASWLDLVEDDVRRLVSGTFLSNARIVRTSATTGLGIEALKTALFELGDQAPGRDDSGLFRLAIDRAFTIAGHGTVVTGTIASGRVAVGDELQWHPEGRKVRVKGLRQHDQAVDSLDRGARAAINLTGVHHTEVHRGQELATPGYLTPSRALSVSIQAAEGAPRPLRHRGRVRLHLGTAEVSATLALLQPNLTDSPAIAQLFLSQPVVAVHGEPFVVREESPPATIGGGRILETNPRRLRRRDSAAIRRLEQLRSADASERIAAVLAAKGLATWSPLELVREAGVACDRLESELETLARTGRIVALSVGSRRAVRLLSDVVLELESRVLRALERLHLARPRQAAIRRLEVFSSLPDLIDESLVSSILDRLLADGRVVGDARTVAIGGFEPKLSHAERRLKQEIAESLRLGRFAPPDLAELSARAGSRAPVVVDLIALLIAEGRIVEIASGFYLDADAEAEVRSQIRDRLLDANVITMAEMRDLLGITRKHAVPIGEYLDRIGFTARDGDFRRLASGAAP